MRRLFQLRNLKPSKPFNVNLGTYEKLDAWATEVAHERELAKKKAPAR